MSVNGVPLDEPYLKLPPGVTKVSGDDFAVTVPKKSLWVMGDNRYDSKDSRYNREQPGNGFVPIENVVGRAFLVSWPVGHWTWLDNYPDGVRWRDRISSMAVADPTLDVEAALHADGARFVIGCDEVGRGAIAGPVARRHVRRRLHDAARSRRPARLEDAQREAPRGAGAARRRHGRCSPRSGSASPLEVDELGISAAPRAGRQARAAARCAEAGVRHAGQHRPARRLVTTG